MSYKALVFFMGNIYFSEIQSNMRCGVFCFLMERKARAAKLLSWLWQDARVVGFVTVVSGNIYRVILNGEEGRQGDA